MYVYGKVYVEGPQTYKGGRYVYEYGKGAPSLLLCEDAKCVDGYEYQDLSMGSESEVEGFLKSLRGDLFIMSVKDYEKYMNEKGAMFWDYGGMPLKTGSSVIITKLVMQGKYYQSMTRKRGLPRISSEALSLKRTVRPGRGRELFENKMQERVNNPPLRF